MKKQRLLGERERMAIVTSLEKEFHPLINDLFQYDQDPKDLRKLRARGRAFAKKLLKLTEDTRLPRPDNDF